VDRFRWRVSGRVYTDRVNELIEAEKHKKDYQPADKASAATNAAELTEALLASLGAAKKTSSGKAYVGKSRAGPTGSKASARNAGEKNTARTSWCSLWVALLLVTGVLT
jgi:hypothetical protein